MTLLFYRLVLILSLIAVLLASPTPPLADVAQPKHAGSNDLLAFLASWGRADISDSPPFYPILTPLATDTTTPSPAPQPTATLAPSATLSAAPSAIPSLAPSSTPIGAPTATPTPVTVTFPCGSALLPGLVIALLGLKRIRF